MNEIFISYRREVSTQAAAGRLADALRARFGNKAVFRDVETLAPGEQYTETFLGVIRKCRAFVVLIDQSWKLEKPHRLDKPNDAVRIECSAALDAGIHIFPVFLDGSPSPADIYLPDALKGLLDRHRANLRHDDWNTDLDKLISELDKQTPLLRRRRFRRRLATYLAIAAFIVATMIFTLRQTVPTLVGLPLDDAQAQLLADGLNVRTIPTGQASKQFASTVVRQSPDEGTHLLPGETVELTFDQGTARISSKISRANDEELRKAIAGTWRVVRYEQDSEVFYDMTVTYSADGQVNSEGVGQRSIFSSRFTLGGRWQIESGRLSYTVDHASYPANVYYQPGHRDSVELIAVTELELVTRDSKGITHIDRRMREATQ